MQRLGCRQLTKLLRESSLQRPDGYRTLSSLVSHRTATCAGRAGRRAGRPAGVVSPGRGWTDGVRMSSGSANAGDNDKVNDDASKVKVLYDGHCPLCVKEIRLLMWANKKKQTMDFVDISTSGYDPNVHQNISYEQAMEVMHVIGKDGQIHTRLGAMEAMYGAVGWGWVWAFLNLPGVRPLCDRAYGWFARNRLWLTGRNPDDCETGTCKVKPRTIDRKDSDKNH